MNDSTDITRVELRVAPGAELAVDEMTAAQLGSRFKDPDEVAKRDKKRAKLVDVAPEPAAEPAVVDVAPEGDEA